MNYAFDELSITLNNKAKLIRIGLQFDPQLQNEFQIEFIKSIQQLCPLKEFFIIGDTSYGSCCCDEITAKHLNADIIIRIGSSCFTLNQSIPNYFLYENTPVSDDQLTRCRSSLSHILNNNDEEGIQCNHVIAFYTEKVKRHLIDIISKEAQYKGIVFADIVNYNDTNINQNSLHMLLYKRHTHCFAFDKEAVLIYIGSEDDELFNELSLRFISKIKSMYLINTVTYNKIKVNPTVINTCLYRRYNLIEKAKQANSFGILIGSLSIRDLNSIITNVKDTLKANNKKCYTFLLGKLTEEKLCNFIEYIDCFVLIACPFNKAFHTKTTLKPIVSVLDIKIAFDTGIKWDASYSFDVNYIQHHNTHPIEAKQIKEDEDINSNSKSNAMIEKKSINEALIPVFSEMTLTTYDNRKFKGLSIEGEKTIKPLIKGKRGIPIQYEDIK